MAIRTALGRIGGAVALLSISTAPALAGGACGGVPCDLGTVAQPALPSDYGPVTISNHTPYDYFDSVQFQRAPHVSITRIHSLPPTVALSDAPVGFTKGCNPNSTLYCRQAAPSGTKPPITPIYRPIGSHVTPYPLTQAPVIHPPVAHHPVQSSRVVAVGRGYDASKFVPRVYGDPHTITPGIAHVPTSIVDRDPYRAQAVLDAGPGGITPALLGMPVRPNIPPRLPIGYPPPYVTATSAQGQQALGSVTVRQGYAQQGYMQQGHTTRGYVSSGHVTTGHVAGPLIHPRPPVQSGPAPTVCRSGPAVTPTPVGRYPAHGYRPVQPPVATPSCQANRHARSRY